MVTVLPAYLGRQGRHVVTSRPHAVSMTEPSQVRSLSLEFVPLCTQPIGLNVPIALLERCWDPAYKINRPSYHCQPSHHSAHAALW
ncbi:hypothetical protein PCANC_03702 [Puccinia coronata f. sp. avenae]|uniref:Uncharacterized protein n=1 Tax=Puccinia coronata f. sp. avenae TaxID=200324 RepID=A0A2N5VXT4_9BASI|nr:hypothetical protein PCANC_03702 [Puccinia coronata f. sp. avenae]